MNTTSKFGTAAAAAVLVGFIVSNLVPGTARTAVAPPTPRVDRASIVGAIQSEYLAGVAADWYAPALRVDRASIVGAIQSEYLAAVAADWYGPASRAVGVGPIAAGRHHIDVRLHNYHGTTIQPGDTRGANGRPFPGGLARVSFDLPAGWTGEGGWAILKGNEGTPSGLAMAPVTIDRVYWDGCRWDRANSLADGPLVMTLDGLAEALMRAGESVSPTQRRIVTFAGIDARYVEVRTPPGLDFAKCDEGRYVLFANGDDQRYIQGAGELDQLWIVDVDVDGADADVRGGLLVIDAASQPGASREDRAELQAIVDSIEIEYMGGS